MIIDTHSHMNDCKYDNDRNEIITNFKDNNIQSVISVSYDFESTVNNFELSQKFNNVFCALGVHPENINEYNEKTEKYIIENANNKKVAAIGEIGLDYHYDGFDKQLQKEIFVKQIKLAKSLNLPIIIHLRDCIEDAFEIINQYKNDIVGGVLHCFSGSVEMAKKFVDMGLYLGIGGVLTFKNAKKLIEAVQQVDLKYILIETDCPYLCPEPHRGERNEPKFTNYVAQKIAEIKSISVEMVEQITTENAKRCFKKLYQ